MSSIDDEFEKIMAGMDDELSMDDPVDESLHLEGGRRSIALVMAPIPSAPGVSELLGMYGISRWVVPLQGQVALYMDLGEGSDADEFASLLGEDRPIPEECDKFARIMSRLTRYGAVAITSILSEDENEVAGSVVARRYVNGEPEEVIPAGLLINTMDERAEDLLLGRTKPQDYDDAVNPQERPESPKRGFGRPWRRGGSN